MHRCCWPECGEEGPFPAPVNPRDLRRKQYFCAKHIKEFNKRWNGMEGFTEAEIYTLQEPTSSWQRPTWGEGLQGQAGTAEPASKLNPASNPRSFNPNTASKERVFASAADLHGFFNSRMARELNGETRTPVRKLPADVLAACRIFSIEFPLNEAQLKPRYIKLAKQYHPDVNKAADAAEMTKRINVAYKILLNYATLQGL